MLDSGVDASHPDLAGNNNILGCPAGSDCQYDWNNDAIGHGTHVIGSILAAKNGFGVVGVVGGGATIYTENLFGTQTTMSETTLAGSWDRCVAKLDTLKATNPNAKLVVSMSIAGGSKPIQGVSDKVDALYSRGDVLFFAAAGNSGGSTVLYPAGYNNIISVAAVGADSSVASFSQYNADVEIAAPGVDILSTLRNADAPAKGAAINPLTVPAGFFGATPTPVPTLLQQSSRGQASGNVVDCGKGDAPCRNANGAICLIELGGNAICDKISACATAGGVGVIIYNDAASAGTSSDCAPLSTQSAPAPVGLSADSSACSASLPAVGVSRAQGLSLLGSLSTAKSIVKGASNKGSVSVKIDGSAASLPYGVKSGTSMATPYAAAAAGVVWSAYPSCSNQEIRNAVKKSAKSLNAGAEYVGSGLVQIKAAMDYLKANPCGTGVRSVDASGIDAGTKVAQAPSSGTDNVLVLAQDAAGSPGGNKKRADSLGRKLMKHGVR